MLAMFSFSANAQTDDYSSYLTRAWECLDSGNCDAAQRNYNVYKEMTGNSNPSLENAINNCQNPPQLPVKKTYNVGDNAKDIVGTDDYIIAYLDSSGEHGFAIRKGTGKYESTWYASSSAPSISELRLLYNNRYVLNLTGEYWSSTMVDGSGSAFTMPKYYTYNFSTGETKKRREPLFSDKPLYKNLSIKRF